MREQTGFAHNMSVQKQISGHPEGPASRRSVGAAIWQGMFHVLGGFGANGTVATNDVSNDLWRFNKYWEWLGEGGPRAARYPSLLSTPEAILCFGGCGYADGGMDFHDALWSYDGAWCCVDKGGAGPKPRYTCALAGSQTRLFMFGGTSPGYDWKWDYHGDLWRYGADGWEQVHGPEVGPGPRYGFGWAGNAEQMIIFGGFDGEKDLNDFWMLDISSLEWRQIETEISPRYCPSLGWANGQVVLFGGRSKVNPKLNHADTWTYDGTWRSYTGPGPGYHAKTGYASDGKAMWLFAGEGPNGHLSDLWRYDEAGWSLMSPARGDDPILW